MPAQGWDRDPSGAHDERWFSDGRPTPRVRDHWPYSRVVLPCLVAFAAAGLIVWHSLVAQPVTGFELARSAVAWVQADRAGQVLACLATTALLITAARRPRWRRVVALTVWGVLSLQFGVFLVAGFQYPGNSCTPRPGWAAITLSYTSPGPTVTMAPGAYLLVTVPGWNFGTATDVTAATGGILRAECTVVLPSGGRRAVFAATGPGTTYIGDTVAPASDAMMPAWGGEVTVREP
jgi:hypothetical protein